MRIPCTNNPEMWFDRTKANLAARECRSCPLMESCRDTGKDEAHGVWGGTTEDDRAPRLAVIAATEREAERRALMAEVVSLRKDGHPLRTIAQMTGLSKTHVANYLNAA